MHSNKMHGNDDCHCHCGHHDLGPKEKKAMLEEKAKMLKEKLAWVEEELKKTE